MPRSYRGIWRAASSASASRLRQLLQSHPNAPVLEQGLAGVARHRVLQLHIACANSGRIAPPIRQDLVSDRDTHSRSRSLGYADGLLGLLRSGAGGHITRGVMYLRDVLLWIIGVVMPIIVIIAVFWFH